MKKLIIFIGLFMFSFIISACDPTTTENSLVTTLTVCIVDDSESATVCYTVTKDTDTTNTDTADTITDDVNATNDTDDTTKDTNTTTTSSTTLTTEDAGVN